MSTPSTAKTTTESGRARLLPLFVAFSLIALGSIIATQQVASAFQYQAALGPPMTQLFGVPLYPPHSWLKWYFAFRAIEHPVVDAAFVLAARIMGGALLSAAVMAIFLRYLLTRDLQKVTPDLHGTAHWMTAADIHASGLVGGGQGVYIGGWTELLNRISLGFIKLKRKTVHYLRHNGPEHILAFAPTRSGKGVGLVLPTLLSWLDSAIVYDIKGEAWALTAGWRQSAGQRTLRFDPADPSGTAVRYNPLEQVRIRTDREVADVQNLVSMIVDPDGKGLNDHWAKTGHALLVGAVLHVLYAGEKKTLEGVAEFLSDPAQTFDEALGAMLETEHDPGHSRGWVDTTGAPTAIHPVVASSARDMLNKAENERSGVLSTAMSFLSLYRDPIVAMNTRCSEFKIADLMNYEVPVTLYLVVRPSDQDRLKPLVRLLINQVVRGLTEKMEFKDGRSVAGYKHRLLLLMDEFPSLGKLEIFESALAFMAGYGMKAYLICQDVAQLQKHYGREEAVTSNCHIRIAYAPNKFETAKMLSDMVGTTTVIKNTYSYSGKRSGTTLTNLSAQASEHARPLLTPDEIMRLAGPKKDRQGNITDAGDMLIFQAGSAPIMGTQILYFRDPVFNERSLMEPPAQSDRIVQGQPAALPAQIPQAAARQLHRLLPPPLRLRQQRLCHPRPLTPLTTAARKVRIQPVMRLHPCTQAPSSMMRRSIPKPMRCRLIRRKSSPRWPPDFVLSRRTCERVRRHRHRHRHRHRRCRRAAAGYHASNAGGAGLRGRSVPCPFNAVGSAAHRYFAPARARFNY
ncbi:hypothetical protein C7E18_00120 [Stenotrophomonas maltophilia]|nr:hypothetical protein C7E18_00120 [Stenotrophomonas maltophilia]